jgi:hypothetical protein
MDDPAREGLRDNLHELRKKEGITMAKFMVVHPIGKDLTLEAATPVAKAIKANHSIDAYWVRSSYSREEGKLYCEWNAKDAESIYSVIKKAVPGFPTEVYKLDDAFNVNSESFR